MLFVTPLTGFNAAVRLFLPIGPDWVVQFIWWLISLASAVNAAGLATVQSEARRFFANLLVSHTALLMIGLELHTQLYPRGALCLWFSVTLSHGGSGSTLRALEAQSGRWTLTGYHGLDEHSPTLAVCFLMPGLESVGFPGTKSFVAAKLLVDGASKPTSTSASPWSWRRRLTGSSSRGRIPCSSPATGKSRRSRSRSRRGNGSRC